MGQPSAYSISGLIDKKSHSAFYPVGDFAGIEIQYGGDGDGRFMVLYFKMDDAFPKLKKVEEKEPDKPTQCGKQPVVLRKHTIDENHWNELKEGMNKEQIVKLFSAPPGDYAPGTAYRTRAWDERLVSHRKIHETLEWRSDQGRIIVDLDDEGRLRSAVFHDPGRDPVVANLAERLKWDRERFAKVKKYVQERIREGDAN
jgi:hypothetical protein